MKYTSDIESAIFWSLCTFREIISCISTELPARSDVADHVERSKAKKTLWETPTKSLSATHVRMILDEAEGLRVVCEFEGLYVRIRTRRDTPEQKGEDGLLSQPKDTLRAAALLGWSRREFSEVDHAEDRPREGVREGRLAWRVGDIAALISGIQLEIARMDEPGGEQD